MPQINLNDAITMHRYQEGSPPTFTTHRIFGNLKERAVGGGLSSSGLAGGITSAELLIRYQVPLNDLDEFTLHDARYKIVSQSMVGRHDFRLLRLERKLPRGDIVSGTLMIITVSFDSQRRESRTSSSEQVSMVMYPLAGDDLRLFEAIVDVQRAMVFYLETYTGIEPDISRIMTGSDTYKIVSAQDWGRGVYRVVGERS